MKTTTKDKKHFRELLGVVLSLKKELENAYLVLKSSINPAQDVQFFDSKRRVLSELVKRLESFSKTYDTEENDAVRANEEKEIEDMRKEIRAGILEIVNINSAFSGLIKKNMHYNQLTISFITDIFNKNSVYNKGGETGSSSSPLKSVLIGSGLRI